MRKKLQMEELVNHLANGHERFNCQTAKRGLIDNLPFMTQLDFCDMQEEEQKAGEERKRQEEAKRIAEEKQRPQLW